MEENIEASQDRHPIDRFNSNYLTASTAIRGLINLYIITKEHEVSELNVFSTISLLRYGPEQILTAN